MTTTKEAAATAEKKKGFDFSAVRNFLPLIGFVVIVAFFAITTHGLIYAQEHHAILSGGDMLMIAACGVWLIMTMGCLDISQGSMLGVSCAAVCALSHISIPLAIVGGIVVGALIGAVNAYFHVNRQIQSFVVTICMMFLLRGALRLHHHRGAGHGRHRRAPAQQHAAAHGGITIAVLIVTYLVTRFTKVGHNLKAIGANERAARFAGIKVQKTKVLVYVIAGAITGFAAFVNAIKVGSVTSTAGNMFETQLLIAMVLGGMPINGGARARFSNIVIGVLSYLVLQKGLVMMGLTTEIQQLVMGVVFVAMVALFSERSANQVIK